MTLFGPVKYHKPVCLSVGLIGLTLVVPSSLVLTTSAESLAAPNATMTDDEQELLKARKANEEAQAEYYRRQTQKLDAKQEEKTFWRNLAESPAAIAAWSRSILTFKLPGEIKWTLPSMKR